MWKCGLIMISDVVQKENSDLVVVRISKSVFNNRDGSTTGGFLPGSHLRLGYQFKDWKFWALPSHPYSIASNYEDRSSQVELVVKKTRFQIVAGFEYSIHPHLPSALPLEFFQTVENISIVCGGSGLGFGLPIFNYFKEKMIKEGRDIKLNFIWITRNEGDLYLLNELAIHGVTVYVTNGNDFGQDQTQDQSEHQQRSSLGQHQDQGNSPFDDIELSSLPPNNTNNINNNDQEMPNDPPPYTEFAKPTTSLSPLPHESNSEQRDIDSVLSQELDTTSFENKIIRNVGRPNLSELLAEHSVKTIDYANKWVVSCGPRSLNCDCQKIAESELKCRYFTEDYAM
ncbi:unnamed protein product [Ambrosiozyma monospora]|uniref:Unnamed protein product n=1 Tax=Ambrosiozyma monospora TaxID=43982 RepID=A0A9W7DFI2_AMBMO|nr:unnamed protein product [Ambrosiozyma monospora]